MSRLLLIPVLFVSGLQLNAQCDSVSTVRWLSTIDYDTVCQDQQHCWNSPKSIAYMFDSTWIDYTTRDTSTGAWTTRTYYNYQLEWVESFNPEGDTHTTYYYDQTGCALTGVIKCVKSERLCALDGGPYGRYLSDEDYDEQGRLEYAMYMTAVVRHGVQKTKVVSIRYWRGHKVRRKVRYTDDVI